MLRGKLIDIARFYLSDEDEAEDIVQEAMLKLWLVRDRLDREKNISPMGMTVTRNLCIDRLRRLKTHPHESLTGHDAPDGQRSAQAMMEDHENAEWMRGAVRNLPDKYRGPTDRSSDATEAYTSHRTHRRTLDSGSFRCSRMFFLRHHRLAKGSRTAYKFHPHAPYRPHGSKVENRYGIHRKASTHCVDRQNNHSPGHDCPPRKPPKRTNVGSPLDRTGHVLHQNGLNPPVRHHPTRRGHGSRPCHTWPTFRPSSKSRKEEWTNFPNNMK